MLKILNMCQQRRTLFDDDKEIAKKGVRFNDIACE